MMTDFVAGILSVATILCFLLAICLFTIAFQYGTQATWDGECKTTIIHK